MTWNRLPPCIQDTCISCLKRHFKAFIKANGHVEDVKYGFAVFDVFA